MPSRIIRESARTSPTLDALSAEGERLFWRLTIVADDFGRFDADPRVVAAQCFPLRFGRLRAATVERWLRELVQAGAIVTYASGDRRYGAFPSWAKHQRVRNSKSRFPEPPRSELPQPAADRSDPRTSAPVGIGYGAVGMEPRVGGIETRRNQVVTTPERLEAQLKGARMVRELTEQLSMPARIAGVSVRR